MESPTGSVEGAGRSSIATINQPDLGNLAACTEDARLAGLDSDPGPESPTSFFSLRGRLEAARSKLPPLYRNTFGNPYIAALDQLGEAGFVKILVKDPARERLAGLMLDIAQTILQQGEGFEELATDAFQEVASDLYDGFLSAEDRRGVSLPELERIAPLVKWGNPDFGPYTWPIESTSNFGVQAAVVSLPPAQIRRGLLGWAALGHETAGHDILSADDGLREELVTAIQQSVGAEDASLAEYWSERIDETASDVLGILNMGPAAGIGLVGFFRGLNAAFGGSPRLRNEGPASDPHPADILRGYLAAETVNLLKFTGKAKWGTAIRTETEKDFEAIVINDVEIEKARAIRSAELVAQTLVGFKARSLEGHALGEIQNWRDTDERKVRRVRHALRSASSLSTSDLTEIYAAHVVAAAVVEGLAAGSDVALIFRRMVALLGAMHDANPSWGPLLVRSPGDISRDVAYVPTRRMAEENGPAGQSKKVTASPS